MLSYEVIEKNFRLMLVQVTKQLENTAALLDHFDPRVVKAIQNSESYIDTQRSMIEDRCFEYIRQLGDGPQNERQIDSVRALNVISSNLERISDFSVNITRQLNHLGNYALLKRFEYRPYLEGMLEGIEMTSKALAERDSALALRIGRIENESDQLYRAQFQQVIKALRGSEEAHDLVTVLFVVHYLERMGDALLNIAEAIIFAVLGERLKIRQYRVLDDAFAAKPALEHSIKDVDLASIWGTRSGVRIGTAEGGGEGEDARRVLFKEGNPDKLQREKDSLQRWKAVAPGLVPAVVEYQHKDAGAALLLQYLDGTTFQDILINGDPVIIREALDQIKGTVGKIWGETKKDQTVNGKFLGQLRDRVDDVYRLHPDLRGRDVHVGGVSAPSFAALLEQCHGMDAELSAPFSVFIHGDFNLDNIIYNAEAKSLHFVDVQRSRDMDYVQDVSVFLVSAFRLPVFEVDLRRKMEAVSLAFLAFARDFAAAHGDSGFEARLALGLVRSLVTSTRFELNRRFAHAMQQRATLLLQKLLAHRGRPWSAYRVADEILVY